MSAPDEDGLDPRILAASEVYRDRALAELEADGARLVRQDAYPIGGWDVQRIHVIDWRTGEVLVSYFGAPEGLAEAVAAVDGSGTWVWTHPVCVAAAEQAIAAVRAADEAGDAAA